MIEIINLCRSFSDHKVLDNLCLNMKKGETTVIIGRSGCGKSVLLKHIVGLLKPQSGQVIIDDVDITRLDWKEMNRFRMKIGMLFQGAALFDSLTVGENVGFALYEHSKMSRHQIARRVRECLGMVGLRDIEHLKPAELSGGMRKRVGLARSICINPEIILYDEPTTGVDPVMGDAVNNLIKRLHDRLKVTSVAVTHDMTSAYTIADRIAMMYNGRIIFSGTPAEVKNSKDPVVHQFIRGESKGPLTNGEEIEQ